MSRPPNPLAVLEQAQRRLLESLWGDDFATGSDSWLRLRDRAADPNHWVPISVPSDRRHGQNWPLWRTEQELDDLRQRSRVTAGSNGYAMCLIQNLQNYVVGDGCKYRVKLREGLDADPGAPGVQEPDLVGQAQAELDRLMSLNRWNGQGDPKSGRVVTESREREILRRVVRDGECFLRYYEDGDDLHTRFLEPEQVRQAPAGATQADGWSFGTQHQMEPYEDVETQLAYHVLWQDPTAAPGRKPPEGETVDAAQILHLKAPGTDATLARGTPLLVFDVGDALERASKLQRYLSISSAIRAATAEVWKYQATQQQVQSLSDALKTGTRTDPESGKVQNVERLPPGSIRRVGEGMEPVPQPTTTGVPEYLQAAQGDLRLASAGVCAPEYMTGDASNANYASTQEAGAPWVQQARSLQSYYQFAFLCVAWRLVRHAVECGRLPERALADLEIQVEAPAVLHKDPLQTAQTDKILSDMGAKSVQTVAMEHGLDPETEAANREEWQARFPPQPPPGQPPGEGGQGPGPFPRMAESLAGRYARLARHYGPDAAAAVVRATAELLEGETPRPFDDEDPEERAALIAEILAGLYGDDALKLFDAGHGGGMREGLLREAWDPIQHPRGPNGRFIKAGSTQANQAAHARVKDVLAGDRTPEGLKVLVEHLSILTVKQLHELKRAHGLKASGKNKAELARKIAERLPHAGKPAEETPAAPAPRPPADHGAHILGAFAGLEGRLRPGAEEVSLADLRDATGLPRADFDAALQDLRRRRVVRLVAAGTGLAQSDPRTWEAAVPGEGEVFTHLMRGDAYEPAAAPAPAERPGWSAPTTDRFGRTVRKHAGGWQVESTPSGVHNVVNGETREERGSFHDLAQAQASAESAGRFGTGPTTAERDVAAVQARPAELDVSPAPPAAVPPDLKFGKLGTFEGRRQMTLTDWSKDYGEPLRSADIHEEGKGAGTYTVTTHDYVDAGKGNGQMMKKVTTHGRGLSLRDAKEAARRALSGPPAPEAPAAPAPSPVALAAPAPAPFDPAAHVPALIDAVRKHGRGANLADLVPVRAELGHLSREQQDAVIHHARQQRHVFGTRYEGRHGLTPEQRAAQHQPPGTEDREGSGYGDAVGMLSVRDDALSGVGSAGKKPPTYDAGAVEADLRAANAADPRTGLGPTIPDLYDRLKGKHPGLTEPAFHAHLQDLQRRGKVTLQTWDTSVPLGRSGHPPERFPRIAARGAPAGWVRFAE